MQFNLSRLKELAGIQPVTEEDKPDDDKKPDDKKPADDDKKPADDDKKPGGGEKPTGEKKPVDGGKKPGEKKPPFGDASKKPDFPAAKTDLGIGGETAKPMAAKAPGAATYKVDPETSAMRAEHIKRAGAEAIDTNAIRDRIKYLAGKAHDQLRTGDKNIDPIKSEIQHYLDVAHANLHTKHGFPFVNPMASAEDKQAAKDVEGLANNIDTTLRMHLGIKPVHEIDWLR